MHRHLTPLAALTLALTTLASPAVGQLTSYGFDGIGAPGAFSQIFPGFANGPHLEYDGVTLDGGVILIDALFGGTATTGDNILATCDTCGLGDQPPTGLPGEITGTFDAPASHVELDVINGVGSGGAVFTLTGFDAGGSTLGSATVSTGPAGGPAAVAHLQLEQAGMWSFTLTTELPQGYTFAMDSLKFGDLPGTWSDLGGAMLGSNGFPTLEGSGPLTGGSANQVRLARALPGAPCWFVLGFGTLDAAFKGGVLVPTPDLVLDGFVVGPTATLDLPFTWPAGVPAGAVLVSQAWISDPAGPKGFAASNGLEARAP